MTRRNDRGSLPIRAMGRCLALVLGAAVLAGLPLAGLQAKPEDGKKFQDWTVRCAKSPQDETVEICAIVQVAVDNSTKRPVMKINVGYAGKERVPLAIITVPLVVRLPPGMAIQIDGGKEVKVPFEVCNPDGCEARFRVSEDLMSAFRAGVGGVIKVQMRNGQNMSIPLSLKGFTAALTALQ